MFALNKKQPDLQIVSTPTPEQSAQNNLTAARQALTEFESEVVGLNAEMQQLEERLAHSWDDPSARSIETRAAEITLRLKAAPKRKAILEQQIKDAAIVAIDLDYLQALADQKIKNAEWEAATKELRDHETRRIELQHKADALKAQVGAASGVVNGMEGRYCREIVGENIPDIARNHFVNLVQSRGK